LSLTPRGQRVNQSLKLIDLELKKRMNLAIFMFVKSSQVKFIVYIHIAFVKTISPASLQV